MYVCMSVCVYFLVFDLSGFMCVRSCLSSHVFLLSLTKRRNKRTKSEQKVKQRAARARGRAHVCTALRRTP